MQTAYRHPLDHVTRGSWAQGMLRLVVAVLLLWLLTRMFGERAWERLLRAENLSPILAGAILAIVERVFRIRKWALLLDDFPVRRPGWTYLLRIQFIGLFANLVIPSSELLKVWAVARNRREAVSAAVSILLDIVMSSAVIGLAALVAAVPLAAERPWLLLPGAGFVLAAVLITWWILRHVGRSSGYPVRLKAMTWLLSGAEALCMIALHAVALDAIGVDLSFLVLVAAYPLLHLMVLVVLTPSNLGLRASVFTLVFAGVSSAPADVAVALGLTVSSMLVLASALGGLLALLIPQRAGSPKPA